MSIGLRLVIGIDRRSLKYCSWSTQRSGLHVYFKLLVEWRFSMTRLTVVLSNIQRGRLTKSKFAGLLLHTSVLMCSPLLIVRLARLMWEKPFNLIVF